MWTLISEAIKFVVVMSAMLTLIIVGAAFFG